MFNSIRESMLAWQAAILIAVVGGFGTALYRQVRHATFEEIDAELLGAAQAVALMIETAQQPEIPESFRARIGKAKEDVPYLQIWDQSGEVVLLAATESPVPRHPQQRGDKPPRHPYHPRDREQLHEMILQLSDGTQVLVGRNIHREYDKLQRLVIWTTGAGLGAIALGLVGGWLVSARVLSPIDRMTRTAEQISAASLSQRLDAGNTKSELGRLAGVLNSMFDRLQSAFERQTRFTADASHELRTPVAIILAQVEQVLAKERSADDYREALEACQRSARRMKSLVDDMLVLARSDAGQANQRQEPVLLDNLVQSSAALVAPLAYERSIQVHLQLAPIEVLVDPEQLGQVIVNLLTNAIHYNRPEGQVFVSLAKDNGEALLRVEDTGEGVAPENRERIFERFYRGDPARTRRRGGSGLGLAICREIVVAHGGTIAVDSAPDHGAAFTVRLPIHGAEETLLANRGVESEPTETTEH